VTKTKIKTNER